MLRPGIGRVVAAAAAMAATVMAAGDAAAAAGELRGLEDFVDGVVAARTAQHKIAGVTLAIVHRGAPVLVKGYGLAAVGPDRPVDPQRSLFRVGSISKTFTWIALVQLAERGRLALTDPVNQHLPADLRVPDDG